MIHYYKITGYFFKYAKTYNYTIIKFKIHNVMHFSVGPHDGRYSEPAPDSSHTYNTGLGGS